MWVKQRDPRRMLPHSLVRCKNSRRLDGLTEVYVRKILEVSTIFRPAIFAGRVESVEEHPYSDGRGVWCRSSGRSFTI